MCADLVGLLLVLALGLTLGYLRWGLGIVWRYYRELRRQRREQGRHGRH